MDISILTLHEANNVGAFLQAFSLQTVLQSMYGKDNVHFVRFSHKTERANKMQKVVNLLKQKQFGMMWFKYQTAKKYSSIKDMLQIQEQPFNINNQYDTVIIGSDVVWEVNDKTFIHHPQYFGKQIKANKIMSYAASAGNSDSGSISASGMDFESFEAVSVRDNNTFKVVKEISGNNPEIVCDPTILIESYEQYVHPVPPKDYILVYSYGLTKEQIKQVREYAKKNKKKLFSVGTYNSWCDKNLVVDPVEFLSWLNSADAVITSTFHGTVLSVRFHKNVAVFATDSHKINYFLEQYDLKERKIDEDVTLEDVLDREIDYSKIEQKIEEQRNISIEYIRKNLEDK